MSSSIARNARRRARRLARRDARQASTHRASTRLADRSKVALLVETETRRVIIRADAAAAADLLSDEGDAVIRFMRASDPSDDTPSPLLNMDVDRFDDLCDLLEQLEQVAGGRVRAITALAKRGR